MMLEVALKVQRVFKRLEEEAIDYVYYFDSNDNDYKNQQNKRRRVGVEYGDERRKVMASSSLYWSYTSVFTKFLKKLYDTTLKFSSYKIVIGNVSFCEMYIMVDTLKNVIKSEDELLKMVATLMTVKFEKYWGNIKYFSKIIVIRVVIDPCFKKKLIKWRFLFRVKSHLFNKYEYYKKDAPRVAQWSMKTSNENEGVVNEEEGYVNLELFMRRIVKT